MTTPQRTVGVLMISKVIHYKMIKACALLLLAVLNANYVAINLLKMVTLGSVNNMWKAVKILFVVL